MLLCWHNDSYLSTLVLITFKVSGTRLVCEPRDKLNPEGNTYILGQAMLVECDRLATSLHKAYRGQMRMCQGFEG